MRKLFLLLSLSLFATNIWGQSPGGVTTNFRWWLKANAGVYTNNGITLATDGQAVQQWSDQSPLAIYCRQGSTSNKPIFKTNIINGNPVLRFATDQYIDASNLPGVNAGDNFHMFIVLMQNSYTAGGVTDGGGTYIIDRTSATSNLMSFKLVNTDKFLYQKRNDGNTNLGGPVTVTSVTTGEYMIASYYRTVNTAFGIYLNGRLDATSGGDNDAITAPQLRVGRHATTTGGGIDGDLAEIILYNRLLTGTELQKINSYLAIKYGITLDQTSATNYLNSAGTVIYPATTTHNNYLLNIAGIAHDDGSALNQTASQSQNSQSIVKISNPSGMTNGESLVWGNDSPVIWNTTDAPSPFSNRITRVWRAAMVGNVGTFDISFDLTGLGIDLTDPTKFAMLIDDDGVFSNATAYTTGRTVNTTTNVVSFTGAALTNNQYFSIACPTIPGPGGVAGTTVWLRADEDVYNDAGTTLATNNQSVQQWNTKNGTTGASAKQATGGNKPTYITNSINSNAVVRFATTKYLDLGSLGITPTSDISMTMAFKPATITAGDIANTSGSYLLDRTSNTTPVVALKFTAGPTVGFQEQLDAGAGLSGVTTTSAPVTTPQIVDFYRDYSVNFGIFYNGAAQNTMTDPSGPLTFPTLRLGATQGGNSGLDGDIAEYIFYNRDITNVERNRIDSYLAIKYGVTLDQVTATNYTSSSGVVVYPATSASHIGYRHDIFGIGLDAVSRLSQTTSKSQNTTGMLTLSNASAMGDLEFFIVGDDGGSITNNNSTDVDGTTIKRRLNRIWKVAEMDGDVGNVRFAFDLNGVPGAKTTATLRILIDRDGDGFADNDVTPVTFNSTSGGVYTRNTLNLVSGDRITIGSTDLSASPLPIQLLDFDVSLESNGVLAKWNTAQEINNDFFTLERSFDGEKFEEALRVKGAGTTEIPQAYEALDHPGAAGKIYYRLKQTDFDLSTTYSEIRVVMLKSTQFNLNIYPNPADGSEFTTEVPVENNLVSMQVLNAAGQIVYSGTAQGPVTKWNMGDLPRGIYFVRVISDTRADVQKLVLK